MAIISSLSDFLQESLAGTLIGRRLNDLSFQIGGP
jgi:hypothetical protein